MKYLFTVLFLIVILNYGCKNKSDSTNKIVEEEILPDSLFTIDTKIYNYQPITYEAKFSNMVYIEEYYLKRNKYEKIFLAAVIK